MSAPSPSVPPFVDAAAQSADLGAYRQTLPSGMVGPYLFGLGTTAVLLCCMGTQVWRVGSDMASGPYVNADSGSTALFLVATALFAVAGLAALTAFVGARVSRDRFICEYEQGFVRVRGGRAVGYRWDAVRSVNHKAIAVHVRGLAVGNRYRLKIIFTDGRIVRLNSITDRVLPFLPVLRAGIRDTQELPPLIARIQDSGRVLIGPYALTARGVSVNEGPLRSWTDLVDVTVLQGRVVLISRAHAVVEAAVPAARVPNLDVFLALARHAIANGGIQGPREYQR